MATSASFFVCLLCGARSPSITLWMSHLRQVYSSEGNLSLNCPSNGCSAVYSNVNSLCSHIYRKHHQDDICTQGSDDTTLSESTHDNDSQKDLPPEDSLNNNELMENEHQSSSHDLLSDDENEHYAEQPSLHVNFDPFFEQKKRSCLLLMQLKEEKMLYQTAVNDVVKGCHDIVSHALHSVKLKVDELQLPSQAKDEIIGTILDVSNPFGELNTQYLQDKFISKEMGCIVCVS